MLTSERRDGELVLVDGGAVSILYIVWSVYESVLTTCSNTQDTSQT